jgi:spore coat protein U domain-containing protein, fimbrial subunit CupE1/2/3/6
MSWRPLLIATTATIVVLGASTAHAAPSCTISTTSVNFGNYNVFTGSDTDSTGTVTIDCNGAAHDIIVTLSKGASSSYNPRTMLKASEALSYNLYRDAARTSIWGDGTGGTSTYTNANPPNGPVNVTIYGRVPAGQDVSAGAYSDTVSAVVNF